MPRVYVIKELITSLKVTYEVEVPDGIVLVNNGIIASPELRILVEDAGTGEKVPERTFNYTKEKPIVMETRYGVCNQPNGGECFSAWYYGEGDPNEGLPDRPAGGVN